MIPACFSEYSSKIPVLNEAAEWSLLRKWTLSEVYRIKLADGETRIVKWGGSEMAGEAGIYRNLVQPLQIKAPRILAFVQLENSGVMVMEDVGEHNVEQQPHPAHFLEAARELARLRTRASRLLDRKISPETIDAHYVSAEDFLKLLDDLLNSEHLAGNEVLSQLAKKLPDPLEKLYRTVPNSIIHHDYHAKNLVIQENGIAPIDWPNAYLSPHLGDLYCLLGEASFRSQVARTEMLSAFLEASDLHINDLRRQLPIGGICWLIKTLHWLVHGGTAIIPGSDAWIPDLLNDAKQLYREMS
ncbi:phosphotransferase [Saccharibacillus sacchari]|uniref:Phosphotransferase n=1 Tax=Saccharibacillus sacchari TaxID=456493 RepID=A0ACC6PDD9_9BACL